MKYQDSFNAGFAGAGGGLGGDTDNGGVYPLLHQFHLSGVDGFHPQGLIGEGPGFSVPFIEVS